MCKLSTTINFSVGGYSNGDDFQWNSKDRCMYAITFKASSMDEITYSMLVHRICMKIGLDQNMTKLKLSYLPVLVKNNHSLPVYIFDDEDIFTYLTTVDKDLCRSALHVEVTEDLEGSVYSSFGVNYDEEAAEEVDEEVNARKERKKVYINEHRRRSKRIGCCSSNSPATV